MPKTKIITGLDIGTSSTKIIIAQKRKGQSDPEVLDIKSFPSFGVRKGVVINPEEVSKNIQSLISKTSESSSKKIESVYININGNHLFIMPSHGLVSISRADQRISQEDILRVIEESRTVHLPSNIEILDVFPKEFIIDGRKNIKEPLEMHGVRLEVDTILLCGFSPYLKNLTNAVLSSGLQIDDLIPSPLAAARAVLNKRQKELGVALIDIGAGTTSLAVFEEGNLIHLAVFPIGSDYITNDIAIGLRTDIDTAERIKKEFGACIYQSRAKKSKGKKPFVRTQQKGKKKQDLIKISRDDSFLSFSKKMLAEIIEARVCEIFNLVNKELKKISRQKLLPAGIVLTGGGAKLPKIVELAKKELKLPAQIGKPTGFFSFQDDPSLATLCGLVLEGFDLEKEGMTGSWSSDFKKGIFGKLKRIFKIFVP